MPSEARKRSAINAISGSLSDRAEVDLVDIYHVHVAIVLGYILESEPDK